MLLASLALAIFWRWGCWPAAEPRGRAAARSRPWRHPRRWRPARAFA